METITATERSTESLNRTQYGRLEKSDSFVKLLENGVVTLLRSQQIPFGVRGSSLVGQALLEDGTRLVIQEKSPGALKALLNWSLPEDLRAVEIPSSVSATGPVLQIYARQFLTHLGYYLRHGRIKNYRSEFRSSSTPSGRVDIKGTLRLYARGVRGKIAQHNSILTADILVNRLLALAIRDVERLFDLEDGDRQMLGLARMYAPLFQDVQQREVEVWGWKTKARAFEQVLANIRMTDELQKALSYARAILLHLGAWSDDERGFAIPDSFFLNLETLFQDAVTQVLHETVAPIPTSKGRTLGYPLFPELRDRYIADPDFVIGRESNPFLVGDCKYKDLSGFPAHSDVYQVLSHCLALKNSTALLVYPGDQFRLSKLGETTSGITVHWCTVRIADLKTDLRACMKQFELSRYASQAYAMN